MSWREDSINICRLTDGRECRYNLCSSDRDAYADIKNKEYLGKGKVLTVNGVLQSGKYPQDEVYFWWHTRNKEGKGV